MPMAIFGFMEIPQKQHQGGTYGQGQYLYFCREQGHLAAERSHAMPRRFSQLNLKSDEMSWEKNIIFPFAKACGFSQGEACFSLPGWCVCCVQPCKVRDLHELNMWHVKVTSHLCDGGVLKSMEYAYVFRCLLTLYYTTVHPMIFLLAEFSRCISRTYTMY